MSILNKIMNSLKAGYEAFTEDKQKTRTDGDRAEYYNQCWSYYINTMFSRRQGYDWTGYLAARELYTHTRLIYNPVPEIVNFYVDNIWQLPTVNPLYPALATPVDDTGLDPRLIKAVEQLDQWGNWATESLKAKQYAAASGGVLIEGLRDFDRQKILHKIIWGEYVTHLELNDSGDVLAYTLEYKAIDPVTKKEGHFRKVVTREQTEYYLDDKPYVPPGINRAAVEPNPLGFCFAVWLKHNHDGRAAVTNYDKVDEANSLASHLHDNIHKLIESPVVVATDGEVKVISGARTNADGTINPIDPRTDWLVFKVPAGGNVLDLASKLKINEGRESLTQLLDSFSEDYPELQARSIIMNSAEMSGAALDRKLTPAQNRLDRAAANYNRQLVKFRQMQISAGGYAFRNEWVGTKTRQQQLFAPFDLSSYDAGAIDFNLKRSLLIEMTEAELVELEGLKLDNANKATGILTLKRRQMMAGLTEEETANEMTDLAKEDAAVNEQFGMTGEVEENEARLLNA